MNFDNVGVSWIKKDMLKNGMMVKILSEEPSIVESTRYKNEKTGKPSVQYVWAVEFENNEYRLPINFTSIKEIKNVYGAESKDWLGKMLVCDMVFDRKTGKNNTYWLPVQEATANPAAVKWEE